MKIIFTLLALILATNHASYISPLYAQWAHHHVVWINGKQQNQEKFLKMIDDYQKHDIKVGGALIDSAWSTEFNNFQWDRKKFPNAENIVQKLHSKDIKLLLWVTSMINNDTIIYQQALKNNYLLNHGKTAKWWHGRGAFLDYLNPKAVQWWHRMMDKVLNIGVDGFKCDGTDPITIELRPLPYSPHAKRYLFRHEYGHLYYGDFYNYTKSKNQNGLIMSRPTDTFQTYISWNYSPRNVMFSGWVGDQDSSSQGLKKAMYNILKSAWSNYLNFGFDIGGYRGQNITKSIFLRWVQTGSLLPFMENGGNGKHQPWLFDEETVAIYRQFVNLHYNLKPTFLTCGYEKYHLKKSVITPLAKKIGQDTIKLPSTYCYLLCDNLLISPIFEQNGQAEVIFPNGSDWVYYYNKKKIYKGGSRIFFTFQLNETALFMKTNQVIVFDDEIVVVGVRPESKIEKKILYGSYSDQLFLQYHENTILVKIDRYYQYPLVLEEEKLYVKLKLLGLQRSEGFQKADNEGELTYKIRVNDGTKVISNLQQSEKRYDNILI